MNIFKHESKNEILQIRDDLDGNNPTKRKAAAKKTISLMRQGENVQSLFASMLRCVKTPDIELKRLSYLYLVHYSTQEPEQAIMAVNTFIQDSQDDNPLIRALAVRTMCRIRLENIAEHMLSPLKKALEDQDPYVRKTAALGVAKLYEFVPESVENANLLNDLLKLLHDENPMVVSNTTAAIVEINEHRTEPIFKLTSESIGPLLSASSACTEWCLTILLDALSHYKPESADDAAFLIDRLIPFLKHANPAVVVGAFKCIFLYMEEDKRPSSELFPQIIPPFITLVTGAESEIQYVVLRTWSLFVRKYPKALQKDIRMFFCKYNDPSYIKMEKLDIIVTICGTQTAQLVLDELNEYCNSVDVAFVQKSIKCIGQIAIKIEPAARRCVDILVGLVQGKADYAIEESIIVITNILRKYPGVFENVIGTVCQSLENVNAPRAKAAGIWILGEYCNIIEHIDMLLDPFLDTFHDEEPLVQLQIIVSLVKVYLEKPEETKDQLQFLLTEATKEGVVPDVKSRAMIYWRLLSSEGQIAKDIIIFSKETIVNSAISLDEKVLDELIKNMGSVSGVLHIVPEDFVRRSRFTPEDESSDDDVRDWHPVRIWINDPLTGQTQNCPFLELYADYTHTSIYLRLVNKTPNNEPITNLQFAVNANAIGLTLSSAPQFPQSLEDAPIEVRVPIFFDSGSVDLSRPQLQIALNTSKTVVYGVDSLPAQYVTDPEGNIGQDGFRNLYAQPNQDIFQIAGGQIAERDVLKKRNVFFVGKNGNKIYVSLRINEITAVCELSQESGGINGIVKGDNPQIFPLIKHSAKYLFA